MGMHGSFKVFTLFWHHCCDCERSVFISPLPGQNGLDTPQQQKAVFGVIGPVFELRAEWLAVLLGAQQTMGKWKPVTLVASSFAKASFADHYALISPCCG